MQWRLRLAEADFSIAYKNGADTPHADALSRLLAGSLSVSREEDADKPAFILESDHSRSTNCNKSDLAEEIRFLEADYEPVDELPALLESPAQHVQFEPISMAELILAQYNDGFRADVYRRLSEGEGMAFELDEHGLLVRTATSDRLIVILHA